MRTIAREYTFEAAHQLSRLPEQHKCHRLHGHSYRVRVFVTGPLSGAAGFVVDFAEMDRAWARVHHQVDHRYLNEVPGLDNPTAECLSLWILQRVEEEGRSMPWPPRAHVTRVELYEGPRGYAVAERGTR